MISHFSFTGAYLLTVFNFDSTLIVGATEKYNQKLELFVLRNTNLENHTT